MQAGAGLSRAPQRRRFGASLAAAVVAAALVAGGAAAVVGHELAQRSPPSPAAAAAAPSAAGLQGQATWGPGVRPAPGVTTLHDQSGHRFSLASLRGHTVAMEFFDSHCHAECPLAGRALAAAERNVPAAQRPVLVVISVNPLDTAASVRSATREWGLAGLAPWHWLMGTHALLAAVWRAYHIDVHPKKGDISHTEALYLLDRRGDERAGYLYPYVPASVAHDLAALAHGGGPA